MTTRFERRAYRIIGDFNATVLDAEESHKLLMTTTTSAYVAVSAFK